MKVGLVIADLNIRGGTHKQLTRLAEFLQESGCKISIHTFDFDRSRCYPEVEKFQVVQAPRREGATLLVSIWRSIVASWRLVRAMPADIDIINVHDLNCYSVMPIARLLRPRAKLVWQINDFPYAFHVGPGKRIHSRWSDPIIRNAVRTIAQLCDAITVNVRKNQELASELLHVQAHLYYPGVDQICTAYSPRTLSRPLRLLSAGVFLPYRNYESILDAMDLLRQRDLATQLTLVGATDRAPDYSDQIAALAKSRGLDVAITGEIDEERFKDTFQRAHAFLFVNVDQSWGLAVFEAMNMSLPVIVSKSVGAVELLEARTGAQIVDPTCPEEIATAIERIHENQQRYAYMAESAFEFSQSLGWDKLYCPDVLALFKTLTSYSS